MCSHVYLLPFQCLLVWPAVSLSLSLTSCQSACTCLYQLVREGYKWRMCFFFFFYLNAITGLTSASQIRSNYLLKDKCVNWVPLTPLVTATNPPKYKTGTHTVQMCYIFFSFSIVNGINRKSFVVPVSIVGLHSVCSDKWLLTIRWATGLHFKQGKLQH